MKLIFIRHGDPDYEKDSLTEKGWREAEILSDRVAKWDIKQIYCSPLGRAKDTCSVTLKKTGREAVTCDWLKEFYYRIWDEQEQQWTIAWDFYPRDFNDRDDLQDKDLWADTEIMKSGDIAKHAQDVYEGFDALLEKHGYKRNDRGFYDVLEHNDESRLSLIQGIFLRQGSRYHSLVILLRYLRGDGHDSNFRSRQELGDR